MPRAFIPAISGAQSTAIAEALRAAGWRVDGSSRSDDGSGDNRAAGADALVLTIPQDHSPGAMTDFVDHWVDIAKRGSTGRIVLNVGGTPGPADANALFADLHTAQARIAASGLPFVILQPTIYLDNLAAPWAAGGLAAGTIAYPAAPEIEISWLSHHTLGQWVVAIADGRADGRVIPIGGPEALSGDGLAREIGKGVDRAFAYVAIPPLSFAEGMNAAMGAPAGDRLASIYSWLSDHPMSMRVDPSEAAAFGVQLETAQAFAARVLA